MKKLLTGVIIAVAVMVSLPVTVAVYQDANTRDKLLGKTTSSTPVESSFNTKEIALQIHSLINQERQKAGLQALTWDNNLSTIATTHSLDMAQNNYFEHTSPSGQTLRDRYVSAQYPCFMAAENLIQGGPAYDDDPDDIASNAVKGWMESQGHRENILSVHETKEGIGVSFTSDGRTAYITEDFC